MCRTGDGISRDDLFKDHEVDEFSDVPRGF